MRYILTFAAALAFASPALGETLNLKQLEITEWKAVYGRVEARDLIPARARTGGTVSELLVAEGDSVAANQLIARVQDDKIAFQIAALDAQLGALKAQMTKARSELDRGEQLLKQGITTVQRLDQLRTEVDVTANQTAAVEAQRSVVQKQGEEGEVLAPSAGRILTVPVTRGAVVLPGETIATLGGGGFFLRLAIPERHASALEEGTSIRITANGKENTGRLAKVYPQIQNGRVIADVEMEGLDSMFVDARVLVEVPVDKRQVLAVPASAVVTRSGIDFVTVSADGQDTERAVVPGELVRINDIEMVEILSGLNVGDLVVLP